MGASHEPPFPRSPCLGKVHNSHAQELCQGPLGPHTSTWRSTGRGLRSPNADCVPGPELGWGMCHMADPSCQAGGGPLPVLRPMGAHLLVLHAEVRGALQIDELRVLHRPDVQVLGHKVLAGAHGSVHHLGGRQVAGLEVGGHIPKLLQPLPAGADGAGARHPVALTLHFQRGTQSLRTAEGVGLGSQSPLPALPRGPAPPFCLPVLSGSHHLLWASSDRAFCSKAGGCCGSLAPPPTWGAAGRGRKRLAFAGLTDAIYTPSVPSALSLKMASSSQKPFMGDIIHFSI